MAQTGDVARRLDQGQPAVETFAEFVWACAQLGYQHPDLTAHIGQVQDWYATEDGLDLRALDADCAALAATADSAEQALRLQNDQLGALERAWQGHGAQAAGELLDRHRGAARQAVAAVRRAADTLAPLCDQLWRAIDSKVAATERIEARCAAQRPDWLAAARTVRTGLGNRDAASELIDAQVKPFVDNDIGADWVPAMRAASAAVADAYAAALAALADGPAPVFEIPGDLGPAWVPHIGAAVRPDPPVSSAATVPAGFTPSVGAGPAPGVSGPAPAVAPSGSSFMSPIPQMASAAPTLASPVDPAGPAVPSVPAATNPAAADPAAGFGSPLGGGLPGAGLSGMGSGVSGLGQQLADLFGGLIGSAGDGSAGTRADTALPGQLDPPDASDAFDELEDPDEPEDSDPEDPDDPDDDADDPDDPDDTHDPDDDGAAEDGEVTDAAVDDQTAEEDSADASPPPGTADETAADTAAGTAVDPEPAVPAAAPVPPAEPVGTPSGGTPCEIAADELPQVGG